MTNRDALARHVIKGTKALSVKLRELALWHIRSAIWDGELTAHMAGKKMIVLRTDLEKWLSSQPVIHGRNRRAA
jgi:hypothetical protein